MYIELVREVFLKMLRTNRSVIVLFGLRDRGFALVSLNLPKKTIIKLVFYIKI
jgi:hypothetical protein